MTTPTETIIMDIEAAIQAAETTLPTILGVVGVFSPGVKALIPFLPLLQVALNTVQEVANVIEGNVPAATQTVQAQITNTPLPSATPAAS